MNRLLKLGWRLGVALLAATAFPALAQTLPVSVNVSGNVAAVRVGSASAPPADLTLTFDDAIGLTPASLGVSAVLVSVTDPALLARLPAGATTQIDPAFPLLVTIEPPSTGGLRFNRTVHVEIHTHALTYTAGSGYRLFKAPLGGAFRDITDEIAPGSVRARGTTGGFSQFLVLTDLRDNDDVVDAKFTLLQARVNALSPSERAPLAYQLAAARKAVAVQNYPAAITYLDAFRARVAARAGTGIAQQWRATRDVDNDAGELLAGDATLTFSIGYLRDFGP